MCCIFCLQYVHTAHSWCLFAILKPPNLLLFFYTILSFSSFPPFALTVQAGSPSLPGTGSYSHKRHKDLNLINDQHKSVQPTFSIKSQNTLQMSYTLHSVLVCVRWTRASTNIMWLHACLVDKRQHKMGLSCATASWMTQSNHPIERDLSHSMIKTWPLTVNVRLAEAGCISKAVLCDYKLSWRLFGEYKKSNIARFIKTYTERCVALQVSMSKSVKPHDLPRCCSVCDLWPPGINLATLTQGEHPCLMLFPQHVWKAGRRWVDPACVYSCLIPPVLL